MLPHFMHIHYSFHHVFKTTFRLRRTDRNSHGGFLILARLLPARNQSRQHPGGKLRILKRLIHTKYEIEETNNPIPSKDFARVLNPRKGYSPSSGGANRGLFPQKMYLIEGTLAKASALRLRPLQSYVPLRLCRSASAFLK